MKMDEHARAWSHEFVSSVLGHAGLPPEQRSSLHWEILSHLHEKAERRVEARGGSYITQPDVQAVANEMGGRDGVAAMFLQSRISASPRAGLGKRTVAFLVDALVGFFGIGLFYMTIGWMTFMPPFTVLGPFPSLALFFAYLVVMEAKFGQTLGKMAFNLRTVMADGRPLTTEGALVRNIAKAVPFLLFIDVILYLLLFRKDDQRLSDRIAKTIVIDATKGSWTAPAPPTSAPQTPAAAPDGPNLPAFEPVDPPGRA
jgi:uncharacterized RDD family membrane protein YckC